LVLLKVCTGFTGEYPVGIALWLDWWLAPKITGRVVQKYTKLIVVAYTCTGTPQCPYRGDYINNVQYFQEFTRQ